MVAADFVDPEFVGDRLGAQPRDEQVNLDFILEAQRLFVVELNVDARPADPGVGLGGDDRVAD